MDLYLFGKKITKCKKCVGSGFVVLEDETLNQTENLTIEVACKECFGKGKRIKRVELSIESIKDLLK